MKSKIVIEVLMTCEKCRSKAMQIAATTFGVEAVALEGSDRNRLVVTGDGVDSVKLTKTLRKKVGRAVIIEQGEVKKKEEEKEKKKEEGVDQGVVQFWPPPPVFISDEWPINHNPGGCSIL